MAVPILISCAPTAGHTGGRTLIELTGTNFALPPTPPPGPTSAPIPSLSVTIGGTRCPAVWVVSSTLIRALTPRHDPSGARSRTTPAGADLPASSITVQNLDATGVAIPGETATLGAAYSFQRPLLDARTTTLRVIEALIKELARQVHSNVSWNPHTDYDRDTGDALNLVDFAYLPGIGLTELRLPVSQSVGDREEQEVELGGGKVAVRRAPVIRDVVFTLIGASDNSTELLALELAVKMFGEKNTALEMDADESDPSKGTVAYQLDYSRGEPVIAKDRTENVEWFQATIAVRRVQETDMPGISVSGVPGTSVIGAHEATTEIAYKAEEFVTEV